MAQQLRHHWFYLRPNEHYWIPFSLVDSASLEHAWATADHSQQVRGGGCDPGETGDSVRQVMVPTDGGRYDVDLLGRSRGAIYWSEPASLVRRCSWFYKGDGDRWFMPYTEDVAERLEVWTHTHTHAHTHTNTHTRRSICRRCQEVCGG